MSNKKNFPKRRVLILGASSDIGLVLCRLYLEQGHDVIAHYRTLRPELTKLCDAEDNLQTMKIDFADSKALENALKNQHELLTSVDIFVNLAAELSKVSFESATAEIIMSTLQSNLLPGLLFMQTIGLEMQKRGWGRLVQASSIGVKFGGGQDSFAYSLSKHALEFIPNSVRKWAKDNVLMNVVRIGVTDTKIHNRADKDVEKRTSQIPMERMATAEEIAHVIYGLGSEQNTYITGQVISASGGE